MSITVKSREYDKMVELARKAGWGEVVQGTPLQYLEVIVREHQRMRTVLHEFRLILT